MSYEMTLFKDPEEKFSIMLPSEWKYKEKEETDKKSLHQFEAYSGCVFQISCNQKNERISQIISENKIIPQDQNLPNVSFIEDFHAGPPMEMYNWMALIGDQFLFAAYFFNPQLKDKKNLALELYDVRFALQHLVVHQQVDESKQSSGFISEQSNKDYLDIEYWRDRPAKYYTSIGSDRKFTDSERKFTTVTISPLKIDVLQLYALLTIKVSQQPNGFFDLLKVNKPLNNTIWWDFVLECDKGFIQVWRTPFIVEAIYYFDGTFNVESFFTANIQRYKKEVEEKIKSFDRHTIYINHYQSYSGCVETLWEELSAIDLTLPQAPTSHHSEDGKTEKYTKLVETFAANSVRYHALAKSLVLNAAFKVESYLNLIIRIGSTDELRTYPEVLSKFLKQDFSSRVKNLRFYIQVLTADIDMGSKIYRETKELMTLRNKYVHYEEDAIHNKLGEVYYDRDYPLYQVEENRPAIDAIIKTYHQPNIETVRQAYETSNSFITMVESLFIKEIKATLQFLIKQNPIGYNETNRVYSAIYTPTALDFFTKD